MFCVKDYETFAKEYMHKPTWTYYSLGSERELSLRENEEAFTRYTLIPRMLRNTPKRDLSVSLLGRTISFPVGIAPTAHQRMAHPDGELAAAKAAAKAGTIYTLSTVSNTSLEEVSQCKQFAPQWMQIYLQRDHSATQQMIQRAEKAGFEAFVVTVDTPVTGSHIGIWKSGLEIPPHLKYPNIELPKGMSGSDEKSVVSITKSVLSDTICWEDVAWIKRSTNLPVILKGILTAEDARLAVEHGASAVWVSNHGGRQLDGVDTALEALPEIVKALEGTNCEIYLDGGVRWGTDVVKALALGAKAVFIGRPMLWGLAHSGEEGVFHVLEILKSELDRAMHLAGCNNIKDIGPHLVKRREFSKL